jgi:hypothetical protein
MTASSLIRLYPPSWRRRYGEEFLATVGNGALQVQQVIDIVAGAIDAWLSSDVRRTSRHSQEGRPVMSDTLRAACAGTKLRFTTRDSFIGAGVMIGCTILFLVIGIVARRNGWPISGEILKSLAFPGSLMLSMPFTFLKGQPWRAQAVIIGVSMGLLVLAGYVASLT